MGIARKYAEKIVDQNDPFILEVELHIKNAIAEAVGERIDLSRADTEGWSEKEKLWQEARWDLQKHQMEKI